MLFKKLIIKKKILTASALLLSLTLAGLPVTAAARRRVLRIMLPN